MTDPLVPVISSVPDAVLDLRYATARNFTGRPLYPAPIALLRRSTAALLATAASALRAKGLRLVIYDAYRPLSVQKILWAAMPDPKFVADPARGSLHNRGGAVDLGLADTKGVSLEMPTDFDAFVPAARHDGSGNAAVLKAAMEAAGFQSDKDEWWHYHDPAAKAWPNLDLPLTENPS